MKLSQALKQKNRLVGEINRYQQILIRENSRRNDNPSKVNREEIWGKITKTSEDLGDLKAKIAQANIPIYNKIERLAELKSRIAFITNLPKREGSEICPISYDSDKTVTYNWDCFINQEECDKLNIQLQQDCNYLQDEIDVFNATTEI